MITLPVDWFKRTEKCFVFTYHIENRTRFIQIDLNEDGAEFFKENGFIDDYKGSGKNVTMFCNKTFYVSGKNGRPVEWKRSSVVSWDNIKIHPYDVIHLAAKHEFDITGSVLGLPLLKNKAKVRSMTKAA